MASEKSVGRLVILVFTVLWTGMVITLEIPRRLPHEERSGKLALVLMGVIVAWSRWRALDEDVRIRAKRDEREQALAVALNPHEMTREGLAPHALPHGARVDLGPCPACGSEPVSVIPSLSGRVEVRCRECGLVAAPPELQPSRVDPDHG